MKRRLLFLLPYLALGLLCFLLGVLVGRGIPAPMTISPLPASALESGLQAPVNLNTASKEELASLPGLSSADVKQILDYRREHGSFSSIEELSLVPGFTGDNLRSLEDLITVGG